MIFFAGVAVGNLGPRGVEMGHHYEFTVRVQFLRTCNEPTRKGAYAGGIIVCAEYVVAQERHGKNGGLVPGRIIERYYQVVEIDIPSFVRPSAVYLAAHFDIEAAEYAARCLEAAGRVVVAAGDDGEHGRGGGVCVDEELIIQGLCSSRRVAVVEHVACDK